MTTITTSAKLYDRNGSTLATGVTIQLTTEGNYLVDNAEWLANDVERTGNTLLHRAWEARW